MICYTDYSLSLLSAHSRGQVTSVLPPPKKNTSYRRLFSLHCEQALVTKFRLKPQPRIMPSAAAHGTLTETPTGHSYWKCVHKNLFSLEGFNVMIKFSVKKKKKKKDVTLLPSLSTLSRTYKEWFHSNSNSNSFLLFTIVKSLSHELNKELFWWLKLVTVVKATV